jgi:oxygen-dependent protoporphyrinogen oxidase
VADAREWLVNTPGVALCGAAYEGVGIPACIGSAQAAVSTLLQQFTQQREWAHG